MLRHALTSGAARLAAAGVPSPRVDAELLAAHVLGIARGRLPAADITADQERDFDRLIARRGTREPLQHILGAAPFGPLDLRVGPGVFIPRPETELLADYAARRTPQGGTVVDLCAGSGALALFLATAVPGARVVAVERDPAALEYLALNIAAYGDGRVQVLAADVTEPRLAERIGHLLGGPAATVVSNPPYVPDGAALAAEAAADPAAALFSGAEGLDLIRALAPLCAALVAPGGTVGLEHDDSNARGTMAALTAAGLTGVIGHADLAGRPRFVTAMGAMAG